MIRLSYRLFIEVPSWAGLAVSALSGLGAAVKTSLRPYLDLSKAPLTLDEARRLRTKLHPLDHLIIKELSESHIFGQLDEASLVRLLPLLAQRPTWYLGERLTISQDAVRFRLGAEPSSVSAKVQLRLVLTRVVSGNVEEQEEAAQLAAAATASGDVEPFVPLTTTGILYIGAKGRQAFWLTGAEALPLCACTNLDNLRLLVQQGTYEITKTQVDKHSLAERQLFSERLASIGVPRADLELLAVHALRPTSFKAQIIPAADAAGALVAKVQLAACYVEQDKELWVEISDPHPEHNAGGSAGLLWHDSTLSQAATSWQVKERDFTLEKIARDFLIHAGFVYQDNFLVSTDPDMAALALDPAMPFFPADWQIERENQDLTFHHDLQLSTTIKLLTAQNLVSLQVDVRHEYKAMEELITMPELLAWLYSGKSYLRLKDGSFAKPSVNFRKSLLLLDELKALKERVLVSPLAVGLLRALGDQNSLKIADEVTKEWLQVLEGEMAPEVLAPPLQLQTILRDYQRHGLAWLLSLHRYRLTGILADDMGLGKTLQTLAMLLKIKELAFRKNLPLKPSLVIAPTSVLSVWRDEAARFTPTLKLELYYGSLENKEAVLAKANEVDLLITSYVMVRRDIEQLSKINFAYVILDEAQSIKNAASQGAKTIRSLISEHRLALTGTPIENRVEELWSIFDFLAPGFLGTYREFKKRYAKPLGYGNSKPVNEHSVSALKRVPIKRQEALDLLQLRIKPLILRRLKTDVAQELPPKIESIVRCDMLPAQRLLYEEVASNLRKQVASKLETLGLARVQLDVLSALMRLRQICCSPALLPLPSGAKVPGSAKLLLFEELIKEALASNRAVIVFSQFVEMQKRLVACIQRLGVKPLWLHGGTKKRDKVVASFQDKDGPPVIVISLRAAGMGLTLTRADTVMHYDPWWNPAVETQATDRTHRLGQDKQVTVYKLICQNSIEERVLELALAKKNLLSDLLGADTGAVFKQITKEDVLALLS